MLPNLDDELAKSPSYLPTYVIVVTVVTVVTEVTVVTVVTVVTKQLFHQKTFFIKKILSA